MGKIQAWLKDAGHWLALTMAISLIGIGEVQARCDNLPPDKIDPTKPQNISRMEIGQDYEAIRNRKTISFGLYEDFAPWSFKDEQGKIVGLDVELAQMIALSLSLKAEIHLVQEVDSVDNDLMVYVTKGLGSNSPLVNVFMHVPVQPDFVCRNDMVAFTGAYYQEEMAIAYRTEDYPNGGPTPNFFRYDDVGVEGDTLSDYYLTRYNGGDEVAPHVHRYPSIKEAMAGMTKGDVKAVMGTLGELTPLATTGQKVHTPPFPNLAIGKWPLGIAMQQRNKDLSYDIDYALGQMIDDGRMAALFQRYGLKYSTPPR